MRGTIVYKMTGSGNDFVMLDGRFTGPDRWPAGRVMALCDRRTGVGADGMVILTPETAESVRMTFWNSDGGKAAMCGNAALCSARLAVYLELVAPGELCLHTDAGVVHARALADTDVAEIKLPDFKIPAGVPGLTLCPGERWMDYAVVGVPHLVVRVEDIERIDLRGRGRELRSAAEVGDAGANVNFVAPGPGPGEPWLIRTFERGVEGETWACGTGTVASAVALAVRGEAALPLRFRSRGGPELTVRAGLRGDVAEDVWLGGQGRLLFRGVWEGV